MIELAPARDARGHAIPLDAIAGLLDLIVSSWHPTAIWLFGSRARGEAHATSDWDLLVLVPDSEPAADDLMAGWRLSKQAHVPADVIPCRASEFEEAKDTVNTLAYEAAHAGVLIYGV